MSVPFLSKERFQVKNRSYTQYNLTPTPIPPFSYFRQLFICDLHALPSQEHGVECCVKLVISHHFLLPFAFDAHVLPECLNCVEELTWRPCYPDSLNCVEELTWRPCYPECLNCVEELTWRPCYPDSFSCVEELTWRSTGFFQIVDVGMNRENYHYLLAGPVSQRTHVVLCCFVQTLINIATDYSFPKPSTPPSPNTRMEAGDVRCHPPVWNLRAAIWFPLLSLLLFFCLVFLLSLLAIFLLMVHSPDFIFYFLFSNIFRLMIFKDLAKQLEDNSELGIYCLLQYNIAIYRYVFIWFKRSMLIFGKLVPSVSLGGWVCKRVSVYVSEWVCVFAVPIYFYFFL